MTFIKNIIIYINIYMKNINEMVKRSILY